MKPSIADILGPGDDSGPGGDEAAKPSIADALGEAPPEDADSGTDVTGEAKKEAGQKLMAAHDSGDPVALFDAIKGIIDLVGLGS